jgi:hypothetical protein
MATWRVKPEFEGKWVYIPALYREMLITADAKRMRLELGDLFEVFFERVPEPPRQASGKDTGKKPKP